MKMLFWPEVVSEAQVISNLTHLIDEGMNTDIINL